MSKKENSTNIFIGNKIRERRKYLDMSQAELGKALDVSYQQIQRYENGLNALAVSKMLQIAQALGVSPDYLYEGMPNVSSNKVVEDPVIKGKPSGAMHILFIDDSVEDEVLFREATEIFDDKIVTHWLQEPEKVIEYLTSEDNEHDVHLIILDINMPKINGLELLSKIKKNKHLAHIPIVMLTNSVREKEMKESYKHHASGFIQKTTDFDAYCSDIERTLNYWLRTVVLPVD